jgi:predicted polyphosphate/ATP-dependent NAD kinase
MRQCKLGLIVNPYAGIGGALALKGSDGAKIREEALNAGAEKLAPTKMQMALEECRDLFPDIFVYTAEGELGGNLVKTLGMQHECVYRQQNEQTEAVDTCLALEKILEADVDLIIFAGGDGTARNVCEIVGTHVPVIGVPAGCKIHSGVYAITPRAAGKVLSQVVKGELVTLMQAEVKDIDEAAFRTGNVIAKHYGEMRVPEELKYIQAVKMGGKESDELVLSDIAAHVIELMDDEPETLFVMGSGSTVDAIMEELGLPNTLLGVDLVKDQALLDNDLTATQILSACAGKSVKILITLIGGQGHILGRGNQQLSAELIAQVGKSNVLVVASKGKLERLDGRPLISDSGNPEVDKMMAGPIPVITGFHDMVLYPVIDV